MNIRKLFPFAVVLLAVSCNRYSPADVVNTSIGVIDNRHSNCVIGPMLPYGSINPSPQTFMGGTDGYHPDEPIDGFAQLHVSGTGWSSYGHFLIQPQTDTLSLGVGTHASAHSDDVTLPYMYATTLDRYGVRVEVSPSHYSAIYRFTYPESDNSYLLLDAAQSIATDIVPRMKGKLLGTESWIDTEKGLFRMKIHYHGGWPDGPYNLYVSGRLSKRADGGVWKNGKIVDGVSELTVNSSEHAGLWFGFPTKDKEQVLLKLAISFSGYERAEELLEEEIPDWNFEKVVRDGRREWNKKLSSIKADFVSKEQEIIFYSALYRAFTLARDRSRDNSKWESDLPFWDDDYAYWDTFRTAWPLIVLIDEDAARDHILSIIDRFEHNGRVHDGFIAGMERVSEQGGNDVDCVITDAFLKGVTGVDWEKAWEVVKFNADHMRQGHRNGGEPVDGPYRRYKELGWIPYSTMSSSKTMEYAYNDWCASLMAAALGKTEDAECYEARSHGWISLWNPELKDGEFSGFIDARREDGSFCFIDTRKYGGSWSSPFYEGSAWTYNYYVPHDFEKMIELMGGPEAFVERLEFGFEHKLVKYDNEPGFLASRAFVHAGRPDLSSKWVHQILKDGFDLTGYPGNDDTGSMGSWYVFCTIGICPNAGQDFYYLNAPAVPKAEISLKGGKKLTITANAAPGNVYIRSCKVNGKEWKGAILPHSEIKNGGTIEFELSNNQ